MHKVKNLLWAPAIRGIGGHEIDLKAADKLHPECSRFWDNYLYLSYQPYIPFEYFSPLYIKYRRQSQDVVHIVGWSPQDETCLWNWLESLHPALVVDSPDSLIIW